MDPIAVTFEHHLLVPYETWDSCFNARLRDDFSKWLFDNIGFGISIPVIGWDNDSRQVNWAWYDDRRKGMDARKWKHQGFKILFLNPRHATLAKLTWGGKEVT
jgi:pimeloyl-ACP methyl ester carboxylesterase